MGRFNSMYCLAIRWQLASYQQVAGGIASHRKMKNVMWLQNTAANSLEWSGQPCEDVSPPFPTRISVICWHLLATRCTTSADDSSCMVFRNTNSHILFFPNVFGLVLVILPWPPKNKKYHIYVFQKNTERTPARDTKLTDEIDQSASSLCDIGREHETSNCSAAAHWAVAFTAVYVDDVPESDAGERRVSFYGHTAVQNISNAFQGPYGKLANIISRVTFVKNRTHHLCFFPTPISVAAFFARQP